MASPPRHAPEHDRWGPSIGFLVVALGLAGGAIAAWWPAAGTPPPAPEAAAPSASAASMPLAAAAQPASATPLARAEPARDAPVGASAPAIPRIPRMRDPRGDQSPDIADYINDGEQPTMNEVIARLHAAGIHTGLGAFNPPGTKPPLVGLAVPEDFALPPGYVRHYQATDDGQRIEPILMFAPDYQPTTADGRPVALPKDRVVPPELAPSGLPLRRIVVPPPLAGP